MKAPQPGSKTSAMSVLPIAASGRTARPPLVCLQHFTGRMDNWDPIHTNRLAQDRPVVLVDYRGVGRSSGETPDSMQGMGRDVIAFIRALGAKQVDILRYQPEAGQNIELERLTGLLKVSVSDFLASARNLESPDELSVFIARRVMRQFAPSLLWITLHDIDIAHAGTFSLYVDAIRRTDRLCAEIWTMIQSEPEYAGRTSLFVLPDFGRDSDETPGGNGFQHHRTGDARSRTTWMLALGPDIRDNVLVDRRIDSMDLVPTLGSYFGFSPRFAEGRPVGELF